MVLEQNDEPISYAEADIVFDVIHENTGQGIDVYFLRRHFIPRQGFAKPRQSLLVIEDGAEEGIFIGPLGFHGSTSSIPIMP